MKRSPSAGVVLFWFRRDLRLQDNTALWHALRSGKRVVPVFIFDTHILNTLADKTDCRVTFIHQELKRLKSELETGYGATLHVLYGTPQDIIQRLVATFSPAAAYANEDYEPYARARDETIGAMLAAAGVSLHLFKDQVIFAKDEIVKSDGTPYTVFTPYSRQWLAHLSDDDVKSHHMETIMHQLHPAKPTPVPSLVDIGFEESSSCSFPPRTVSNATLKTYAQLRDIPSAHSTSQLGIHLRFGTISIRQLVWQARKVSAVFLNELIWREFFQQILWHFPHVVERSFKPQYDAIAWRNNEEEFEVWCGGRTGYPLVDAGMRELNATGLMHNRVRMVVGSFLTKHLLIDWRWGEAYFAEKLLDFELASNNGNWQWAAGTGCDAAPYFRIFNPTEQARKFDPKGSYIRKWVPELGTMEYPAPIVDHHMARTRALQVYRESLAVNT